LPVTLPIALYLHATPSSQAGQALCLYGCGRRPSANIGKCAGAAGGDPKAFSRQYETKLRQAELESIQDYIAESDNLLALHAQVPLTACT
jgi:hypothetical protein